MIKTSLERILGDSLLRVYYYQPSKNFPHTPPKKNTGLKEDSGLMIGVKIERLVVSLEVLHLVPVLTAKREGNTDSYW